VHESSIIFFLFRRINNIRGFSRETLVALVANLESREWRRKFNIAHGLAPEHPRASTTDDVECFFSLLRDSVRKDFTLKEVCAYSLQMCFKQLSLCYTMLQVYYGWRKVTKELKKKRMDPSLPCYYHTSTHTRFYEGLMPAFDIQNPKKKAKGRLPKYELLEANGGRVTLSVRGDTFIRTKFHNVPTCLPPPPGTNPCLYEHSYAQN